MKLIKSFKCTQKEVYGNGSEKVLSKSICNIKTELVRPDIFIEGYSIYDLKLYCKELSSNGYVKYKDKFTFEELILLSKKFDFCVENNRDSPKVLEANLSIQGDYNCPFIFLIYNNILEKKYVLIESNRWQFDFQPRSAGEDQLGEDITYIHGIWENPELPQSIIDKIKGKY